MLDIPIADIENVQVIELLNEVEVYTDPRDGGQLLSKAPTLMELQWVRGFSNTGRFQLVTAFSPEKFRLYKPYDWETLERGHIIYKRDNNEAAFIEARKVIVTLEGQLLLIVEGQFLAKLLYSRFFSLEGDFTANALLLNIMNNNFLVGAGTNRSMSPLVRMLPIPTMSNEVIPAEYRRQNTGDAIRDILEENDAGVRVLPVFSGGNGTPRVISNFDIEFYSATESIAVFDKEWGNVLEQDFMEDSANARNVVIIGDIHIHNNHIRGLDRKEMIASEPRQGATRFTQTARDALNRNRTLRRLSSRIDVNSVQFVYGKDWDIGSIVLSQNRDIGYSEREIVTEIIEFFDATGRNIEVNTGSVRR